MNQNLSVLIGGSFAGIAQVISGHPLDTVKVRYINDNYKNISECIRSMKKEGLRSFYRGVRSPMVGSVVMNVQTFYLYSLFDRWNSPFLAGAMTGAGLSIVESPSDLIKSRMQINQSLTYSQTIRNIGYKNLTKGFNITLIRNIFQVGLYFWGYDKGRNMFENHYAATVTGGMLAGLMCWGPVYPIDNIKTRIQTDTGNKYKGIIDCSLKVFKGEGLGGFVKGFVPCVARAVLVNPFVFLAYETGVKHFQ